MGDELHGFKGGHTMPLAGVNACNRISDEAQSALLSAAS